MKIKPLKKLRLHVETLDRFEAGRAGAGAGAGRISGDGCTVLTTCSPGCLGLNGSDRQAPR
jgi:hypothetical protein